MARERLRIYRTKRNFAVTPEPASSAPDTVARSPHRRRERSLSFMVHKHDARRLHYDLRLETDGVLASWAVPRGPSYNPGERRLAVETEDHPLAYGGFEGRIPDGEYGAGDSLIWDRGTYHTEPPGQLEAMKAKGHIVFVLDGEKLRGRWHLVRTRAVGSQRQWLLWKGKDELARADHDVVVERPESVVSGRRLTRGPETAARLRTLSATGANDPAALLERVWPPMLASTAMPSGVAAREQFLCEVKYDGYRALAALVGGRVLLRSRNGRDLAPRFAQVARALAHVTVGEAVIDGELVALDERGLPDFGRIAERGAEVRYVAFDLLWLDGEDLRARPLEERRELLESLLGNERAPLELALRVEGTVEEAIAAARGAGLEGIVAKRRGSRYEGRRSKDWRKIKISATQDLAIVGWLPLDGDAAQVGALLVAVSDGERLRYAGKVGTGFTAAMRRSLAQLLAPDRVPALEASTVADLPRHRGTRWVRPRHVARVAFAEWTRDGKLRHASWRGLCPDRTPHDCVREGKRDGRSDGERTDDPDRGPGVGTANAPP